MADAATIAPEPVPTASLAYMSRLAKRQATETLVKRLIDHGLPTPEANVVGRSVVDPADARKRLDRLTPVRVPGGTFYAVETLVWAPAVMAYAVNNREAVARHYPAGVEPGTAEAARYRPLRPPTSGADRTARLDLEAEEPKHLLWSLERSVKFLLENNDLSASIAAQGVMQHVTAVPIRVTFADESTPAVMLGTVDGSSRITSAHNVLELTAHEAILKFPNDERAFRSFIADVESALDRPLSEICEEDVRKLRALQLPARIFIGYEPDRAAPVGFAKAVDSYVHLIHVEPPRPWDAAASLDAKAVSVLNELETSGVVTHNKRLYLEGMMTPTEARAHGFGGEADERAIELVALMSSEHAKKKQAVRTGVIVLSKGGQVRKEEKANIAVELALRANRSTLTRSDAKGARETLQNAYLHSGIWAKELRRLKNDLDELRDAALEEVGKGRVGSAARRIAAQGAYWLAVRRVLREARFFSEAHERDRRSASRVLDDLMHSKWGIQVVYRAIVDGREGVPLARVDENGRRVAGISGEPMEMTHDWLRKNVVPSETPEDDEEGANDGSGEDPGPSLPTRLLLQRRQSLEKAVDRLEYAHEELRVVRDTDGAILADKEGLPHEVMEALAERLDALRRKLERYGLAWEARNAVPNGDRSEDDLADERF